MTTNNKVVLCDFSMYPLDKGASLSTYVAGSLEIIQASGLPYRFGPMSTAIEGSYDECMALMERCFTKMSNSCDRVVVNCKIDFRRGRDNALTSKIASVQAKVEKPLNT